MRYLELLAPARNADIGIAAIDCGADAVYIAAEAFGARKDAPNSIGDIARLCSHAHCFGARIFLTVNTIIYDNELEQVHALMLSAQEAGVDAFIVQDPALTTFEDITVPLHASTQCAIRDAGKAIFLESLGFGRLVLERELSLEQIKEIRDAVSCEIECFVHGALCVCYSGQCYMSEHICGRSANRGECIQACRSLYDLADADGNVLVRNKALLSLKDFNLLDELLTLAEAGVDSFKIEGRLKNESYVRNVVRQYSLALDRICAEHPDEYARSSFGHVASGFQPDLDKTFNRGYTSLYFGGTRGKWSSMDAAKSMGEAIGTVHAVRKEGRQMTFSVKPSAPGLVLQNGDGFSFVSGDKVVGFRGDVCSGLNVQCKVIPELKEGVRLWRNISAAFEKELERNACRREIGVSLSVSISGSYNIDITAVSEDGRTVLSPFKADLEDAENAERQMALINGQLAKRSGNYSFSVDSVKVTTAGGKLPLMSSAILNSIRRLIAEDLDRMPCKAVPMAIGIRNSEVLVPDTEIGCKYNVANAVTRELYLARGASSVEPAFETAHQAGTELMRTKYCIRYELGLCPVHQKAKGTGPLYLLNNGKRFSLGFDCRSCEMTVKAE